MTKTLNKSLILVSAIFSFCFTLHAQDFWEPLPVHDSIRIQCIAVNENNHIFLGAGSATGYGGVYRSTDEGQSWDLVLNTDVFGVISIAICECGDIYIGRLGFDRLMVSYNNGDNWNVLSPPGYGNILAIEPIGPDTVFIGSWEDEGALMLLSNNGGMSWDTVFYTMNSSEYIKDILQTQSGVMYLALTGYFPDMGGVYKSSDGGDSWELSGLFNYMVSSLAENSEGDVFAGVRGILQSGLSPGIFVLRSGEDTWEKLLGGYQISDVAINSEDHIYCSVESSIGVIRSVDNGQNFEIVNEGLSSGYRWKIIFDDTDYAYTSNNISLARSISPTVSITEEYQRPPAPSLILYPNPVREQLFLKMISDENDLNNIRVYNSLGVLVLQTKEETGSNNIMLDVAPLLPGFYFIEANTENTKQTGRFIKY